MKSFANEQDFKTELCNQIKRRYGNDVVYFKINDSCLKGLPDLMLCFFGRFVAIECKNGKTPSKKHETLQNYNIHRIGRADGFAFVGRDIAGVLDSLEKIREIL